MVTTRLVLQDTDTRSKHEDSRSLAMLDSTMPCSDRCTVCLTLFPIAFSRVLEHRLALRYITNATLCRPGRVNHGLFTAS